MGSKLAANGQQAGSKAIAKRTAYSKQAANGQQNDSKAVIMKKYTEQMYLAERTIKGT
jgi:hypothetical protein